MYTAEGKLNKYHLVEQYYPLVRRIAFSLKVKLPESVDVDDLIQSGLEGLLVSLDRFDPESGVAFSTFAHQRIKGAMIDELRSRDWLPRSVRRSGRELEACMRRLEQVLGRPPEEREIAEAMGLDIEAYRSLLSDTNNGLVLSLDELAAAGNHMELGDGTVDDQPEQHLSGAELRGLVISAIDALPEREKLVMTLYYQEELNLKEIGAVLDVTESRVSQLHSQAIKRIQARLSAQ